MRVPLTLLMTPAGYFVWATSFAAAAGASLSVIGR